MKSVKNKVWTQIIDQAIDQVAKKDKIVIDLKGYNFGGKSSSSSE